MAIKDRLYDQAINALAFGAGGLDELTFGLSDKYIPGARQLGKENPWASGAGRVGSYAIPLPLPSKLKALAKAPKALERLLGAISKTRGVKGLAAKGTAGAIKGAGRGVAEGEAQHFTRKALGTEDPDASPSSTKDRLVLESVFGAGGRAIGSGLKSGAPAVYNHPALINRFKLRESKKQAERLMKGGTFGSLDGAFTEKSERLKSGLTNLSKKLDPKISARDKQEAAIMGDFLRKYGDETSKNPPGSININSLMRDKSALTGRRGKYNQQMRPESELKNTNSAYNRLFESLGPSKKDGLSSFDSIAGARKNMNERVSKLKSDMRAKVYGDPGQGDVSQNIDAALQGRSSLNDLYEKAVLQLGDPGDLNKFKGRVKQYRRGADLEENMLNYERANIGGSVGGWSPRAMLTDLSRSTVTSAPIRTATGVAMDRIAPKVSRIGGRGAELKSRNNAEKPETMPLGDDSDVIQENEFLQDIPGAREPGSESPAAEASAKKLLLSNPDILAAIKDPADPKKNAAGMRAHEKVAPTLYGRKKKKKEPDPADEDEENPFLQDLMTR